MQLSKNSFVIRIAYFWHKVPDEVNLCPLFWRVIANLTIVVVVLIALLWALSTLPAINRQFLEALCLAIPIGVMIAIIIGVGRYYFKKFFFNSAMSNHADDYPQVSRRRMPPQPSKPQSKAGKILRTVIEIVKLSLTCLAILLFLVLMMKPWYDLAMGKGFDDVFGTGPFGHLVFLAVIIWNIELIGGGIASLLAKTSFGQLTIAFFKAKTKRFCPVITLVEEGDNKPNG